MTRTVRDIFAEIGQWTDPAEELKKRGIKGNRGDCNACPMANFIIAEVPPEVAEITVDTYHTDVKYRDGSEEQHLNPQTMSDFIEDFDNGEIPDLDNNPMELEDWECYCPDCSGEPLE